MVSRDRLPEYSQFVATQPPMNSIDVFLFSMLLFTFTQSDSARLKTTVAGEDVWVNSMPGYMSSARGESASRPPLICGLIQEWMRDDENWFVNGYCGAK